MTNQVTPYGKLTYEQPGTARAHATLDANGMPTGNTGPTRRRPSPPPPSSAGPSRACSSRSRSSTRNSTTSPSIRRAASASTSVHPFSLDNNAIEGRIGELARARLDPLWQQREGQFDQKMANQGIAAGSQAYAEARRSFDTGRNDAYNSMLLDARGQAMNELLTGRNQPINEIAALMGGGQVQQPTFQNTPQVGVGGRRRRGTDRRQLRQQAEPAQRPARRPVRAGLGGTRRLGDERPQDSKTEREEGRQARWRNGHLQLTATSPASAAD